MYCLLLVAHTYGRLLCSILLCYAYSANNFDKNAYHCVCIYYIRDGFYDAFYPPVDQLDAQLAVRNVTELRNNVAPFAGQLAIGQYYYNPVRKNIWVRTLKLHTTYSTLLLVLYAVLCVTERYIAFIEYCTHLCSHLCSHLAMHMFVSTHCH
jgi:hypothetical protein